MDVADTRLAVIGAGLMGQGIALDFALAGFHVGLNDLTESILETGLARIRENLDLLVKHERLQPAKAEQAFQRILTNTELDAVAAETDLIIESIAENLEQKQSLFQRLEEVCRPETILGSNSSSFMPSEYASETKRPGRVLGIHYFNPPHLIPLVEIIPSKQTSVETVDFVLALMKHAKKTPVLVRKEIPGFIANRIQAAVWREILHMVSEGVATAPEIDVVVRNSIGRRWSVAGPFEITELSGLDLKRVIHSQLLPSLASESNPPELLETMVERGDLGAKTGKGFYEWTSEAAEQLRERLAAALMAIADWDDQKSGDNK